MDALNEERGVVASGGRNFRSLKLEKGESALVRFLPVELGPRKTWFARQAKHWINRQPTLCVRQTARDFGGDPEATCILCDFEAENAAKIRDKTVLAEVRKMGAYPTWLTYVYVFETTTARGIKMATPKDELYTPTEYQVKRDGFAQLTAFYDRAITKALTAEFGFMDPVHGFDVFVQRALKGTYNHEKDDPAPIIEGKTQEELLDLIDKSMKHIRPPDTVPPTEEEMEAAYAKAEDVLQSLLRSSGSPRRGASSVDRDAEDDQPSRSSRSSRSSREPAEESLTRTRAGAHEEPDPEPAPTRTRATRPEPEPEPETTPAPRRRTIEPPPARALAGADTRRSIEPPPARRVEPPPARNLAEEELDETASAEDPEEGAEDPPTPVRGGGTATPSRRTAIVEKGKIEDDPEDLPKERRDAAPAEPKSTPQTRLSEGMAGRLGSNLQGRISRISNQPV